MSEGEKRFVLRIGEELYGKIERWSEEEMRSINAQIVVILRDAVRRREAQRQAGTAETEEDIEMPLPQAA